MAVSGVTLIFRRSAGQQAELDRLLEELRSPQSPNYHRWLTPEQFADRFGLSPDDLAKLTGWLESQGLHVGYTARSRTYIGFFAPPGTPGALYFYPLAPCRIADTRNAAGHSAVRRWAQAPAAPSRFP